MCCVCSPCALPEQEVQAKNMTSLLKDIEQPFPWCLPSWKPRLTLDTEGMRAYGTELDEDLSELTHRIYDAAKREFNINSPRQLGEVLFETRDCPPEKRPKADGQPMPRCSIRCAASTRLWRISCLPQVQSSNPPMWGPFDQVAGTGGFTHCFVKPKQGPAHQFHRTQPSNIPCAPSAAAASPLFVAPPGYVLVDADYSQIELRVLAHMANDEAMRRAFLTGKDIHTKRGTGF